MDIALHEGSLVYGGVSAWATSNTDNAWIVNYAYHIPLPVTPDGPPRPIARDDAQEAAWHPLHTVDPSRMSVTHHENALRLQTLLQP